MEMKIELTQSLGISQRMIQSATILQMNSQELENYLKEVAVENPVIDLEEKPARLESIPQGEGSAKKEWLYSNDEQNRVYYSDDYGGDYSEEQDMYNVTDNRGEDLYEFLDSQLVIYDLDEQELEIIRYMVDSLDSRGYLTETTEAVASYFNVSEEKTEKLLKIIQALDPAGVGARSLGECLLLQMDRLKIEDPVARALAGEYLEMLGKNQLPQIARKLKVSLGEVTEARDLILKLNPKPGNSFSSRDNMKYITPEVIVVKLKDYFEILLNETLYPRFTINHYYRKMSEDKKSDKQTRDYVDKKIKQAEWVMQCVDQRNNTLMNVSRELVRVQQRFFAEGPGHLAPLRLIDVAQKIGVHESTVSRAVKDKYLQCSWGVFPMNYFFTSAVGDAGKGNLTAADEVKNLIRKIIDGENKEKPFSDRILADKLAERGVKISRRTVAKYREAIGIKDASGRKVFK